VGPPQRRRRQTWRPLAQRRRAVARFGVPGGLRGVCERRSWSASKPELYSRAGRRLYWNPYALVQAPRWPQGPCWPRTRGLDGSIETRQVVNGRRMKVAWARSRRCARVSKCARRPPHPRAADKPRTTSAESRTCADDHGNKRTPARFEAPSHNGSLHTLTPNHLSDAPSRLVARRIRLRIKWNLSSHV
jgi:hypothetical protein